MSGVAVGTVADALAAIRTHVFERGEIGMAALVDALDRNWEGTEILRQTLVNKTPHYGNDDDTADELAVRVQDIFLPARSRRRRTPTSRAPATGSTCCRRQATSRSAR